MPVLNDCAKCAGAALLLLCLAGCGVRTSAASAESGGQPVTDSIDCAVAADTLQTIVCSNAHLAALNREVARLSELARTGPHMTAERAPAYQRDLRAWVRARDGCGGADPRTCLTSSYAGRIFALRQDYADARMADAAGASSGPVAVTCTNIDARIGAVFIADPGLVRLEWLDRAVTLERIENASGAEYRGGHGRAEAVFWREGDNVSFKAPGQSERRCAIVPGAS